jgi:hypothetical protein
MIIAGIHYAAQIQLLQIVQTLNSLCRGFCFGQGREEHGRENGNDGNHHQKFNQCKSRLAAANNSGKENVP